VAVEGRNEDDVAPVDLLLVVDPPLLPLRREDATPVDPWPFRDDRERLPPESRLLLLLVFPAVEILPDFFLLLDFGLFKALPSRPLLPKLRTDSNSDLMPGRPTSSVPLIARAVSEGGVGGASSN